jgi:hypothetical protein
VPPRLPSSAMNGHLTRFDESVNYWDLDRLQSHLIADQINLPVDSVALNGQT